MMMFSSYLLISFLYKRYHKKINTEKLENVKSCLLTYYDDFCESTVKLGQALDIAAQKMCLVHRYMTK